MNVREPTVGPIVGYTSSREARIWLRGMHERTQDGYRRCFGVLRWRRKGDAKFGPTSVVKLAPHFDFTGVFGLLKLQADTEYEYQAGWFLADAELESLEAVSELQWPALRPNQILPSFRSAPADASAPRSYAVGSCRYLLRLFGGTIFDDRGDKAFRSISRQIDEKGMPVHALLMVGDQIYADDLNVVSPDTTIDQYLDRYRVVFAQENLRRLMGRVPTYMVLDDHEIEDNWPLKADDKDWVTRYPAAIHAYQIYQASHSPLMRITKDGRLDGTPDRFWYTFEDGCCEVFVMDCRTERIWSDEPKQRRMVTQTQMKALLAWLADGSKRVKLVVTSVPFFPDLKSDSDDKWGAYPTDRAQILDHIFTNKVRRVVFLSGDVHCSFSAELTTPADPAFKVISVVSSSFFWPYPHMDEGDFQLKGELTGTTQVQYRVGGASKIHSTDNFCRLDVDLTGVRVTFYERKGDRLAPTTVRAF